MVPSGYRKAIMDYTLSKHWLNLLFCMDTVPSRAIVVLMTQRKKQNNIMMAGNRK